MIHVRERSRRVANWSTFSANGKGMCAVSTLVVMDIPLIMNCNGSSKQKGGELFAPPLFV
jgi:hypothetical protein